MPIFLKPTTKGITSSCVFCEFCLAKASRRLVAKGYGVFDACRRRVVLGVVRLRVIAAAVIAAFQKCDRAGFWRQFNLWHRRGVRRFLSGATAKNHSPPSGCRRFPGETSEQALRRLPRLLRHHRPALVIVCTGGNDFLQRVPPQQTEENINRILQTAKDAGAATVLIAVPKFSLWESNHPLMPVWLMADGGWKMKS